MDTILWPSKPASPDAARLRDKRKCGGRHSVSLENGGGHCCVPSLTFFLSFLRGRKCSREAPSLSGTY